MYLRPFSLGLLASHPPEHIASLPTSLFFSHPPTPVTRGVGGSDSDGTGPLGASGVQRRLACVTTGKVGQQLSGDVSRRFPRSHSLLLAPPSRFPPFHRTPCSLPLSAAYATKRNPTQEVRDAGAVLADSKVHLGTKDAYSKHK
eukprot:751391-Hanusia_phi.AAC.2